ncbi:FACT complex subunit SSRP1 [Nesidiocoris tenuis]|uniref:Odorant receptor n=1 Tax=Nesidiocoris tenuis TaxID=355587 RepID=A0ABN7AYL5_9HEMI|nr:FACT complex subunit SSRP1 [Nesidiocoris tenuis]
MVELKRINAVEDAKKRSGMSALIGPCGGFRGPLYNEHTSKNVFFRFYVHFTDWVLIVNYVTMIAAAVHSQSVLEFVMVGFPISAESLSLFLSYYSGYKNKDLTDLLLSFDDCFPDDPYPEQIDVEIEKASKYFYNFPRSLLWLQVFTMEIYCFIFPITNELMDDYFRPRALPLPSLYPCDWRESRPCFVTIIFIHFLGATYVNWKIIAFSEQFYAHVSRQVVLFRHLNHNLNRILNTIYVENDGSITYTKDKESDHIYIQRQLKLWVKHHQLVMAQYDRLQNLYSWPLFVHFGLVSGALCCSAYATSDDTLDFDANLLCGGFLLGQMLELLYLCRMGDWITIETNELTFALTGVNPTILYPKEAQMLRIILTRMNKASVIRAIGLYPLNTSTLKMLIQSTYSYYTMLKKVNRG